MSSSVSSLRMITIMTIVAALSGGMIVSAYLYTKPLIQRNRDLVVQEAALAVCPLATQMKIVVDSIKGTRFFVGSNAQGVPVRVAVEASGQGFADQIKVLYAYDPATRTITGFKVVESKETPGIGDKIISDADFLANFQALDVTDSIVAVKHGKKTKPSQIDGITGATISSKSVAKLMQKSVRGRIAGIDQYWEALGGK